ncbi:MAG: carboxypeptidase-like regulatory domain-containing protein, partial [Candidatus Sumerlaeia bacterium]|nr:carboxypeptidase-like regulatory domain-containing protein [Candidatus Sumerlaeia bacterium]
MRKVYFYIVFFLVFSGAVLYIYLKQEHNRQSARQNVEKQLAKEIENLKNLNRLKINTASTAVSQKLLTDLSTTGSIISNLDTMSSPPLSSLPNGQIGGRVLAIDKSPIARVEIQLVAYAEAGEKFIKSELSDNEGRFLFVGLPAGTYELRTFHPAYATKAIPEIQLGENQVINDLEIILTAGVRQSGKVINEKSEPIEKATVFVNKQVTRINPSGGIPLSASYKCGETLTSTDGTFVLEHVPGGEVEIGARKSGYSDAVLQLHINEEVEPEPVVIVLKEAAVIGGTVVDPEGKPVEGAEVSVFGIVGADREHHPLPADNMPKATTDKKGEFLIKGLLAETKYDLKVVASGFPVCYFFDIKSNTFGNRLVLCFGGKISGKVTYLADAKPAPDIRVRADKADITKYYDTALTNQNGEYLILNLPAGKYNVSIDSDIYTAPPKENLIVEAGKEVKEVNFKIYRGININGEVVDRRNGTGIADAKVFLTGEIIGDGKLKKNITTEKDGDFVFENLPEGLYYLYAEAKGYVSSNNDRDRKKVLLKLGNPAPFVSIKLQPGGTISGTVYN